MDEYDPTIEDSFRKVAQLDGEEIVIDLLDTAGQEEFRALREKWILSSDGFILVYSIISRDSFELVDNFLTQVTRTVDKEKSKLSIVLMGNKADLVHKREVPTTEGKEKAQEIGPDVQFVETSAKERINIDEPILHLIRLIRRSKKPVEKKSFCDIL